MTSNFVFAGKNYHEPLIDEAHVAMAHGGVEKTMQYLTDRYQSQSLSALVQSFVASSDTCQGVKQSNKPPLGLVTTLHVSVRPCTDISMNFLKLTPVLSSVPLCTLTLKLTMIICYASRVYGPLLTDIVDTNSLLPCLTILRQNSALALMKSTFYLMSDTLI